LAELAANMQKEYQQAPRHHKNRSLPAHTPQPRTAISQLLPPSDACLLKRDEKNKVKGTTKKKITCRLSSSDYCETDVTTRLLYSKSV
jgi:hypothetical protein